MKIVDYIFGSFYLFFESINDGRPGNKDMEWFGAIFVLGILLTANLLSFFSADRITKEPWLYYFVAVFSFGLYGLSYYRNKRYVGVVSRFKREKHKGGYYLITILYLVVSIAVFAVTR